MAIRIDEYGHIIRDDEPISENRQTQLSSDEETPGRDQMYIPDGASSLSYLSGIQGSSHSAANASTGLLQTSAPWYSKNGAFWTITLALALVVAFISSTMIAPLVFETSDSSSDFLESIANFLFNAAPYIVFAGAFVGCIWYNSQRKSGSHEASEYIVSPLCSIAGVVGAGAAVFLLALAIYIVAAVIAIAIAIGIIAGLFSGG